MDQQEKPVVSINDVDRYFEQQVSIYQHEIYAYALRQTHHTQDAEDIFQETIVRAYLAMKSYSLQEVQVLRPRSWLYKIMTNVFLNAHRIQKLVSTPFFISEDSQDRVTLMSIKRSPIYVFHLMTILCLGIIALEVQIHATGDSYHRRILSERL